MKEGMYYAGRVVRILKYGKTGFIRTFTGEEVFFKSGSYATGKDILEEGDCVLFRAGVQFDEAKGRDNFIATCVEKIVSPLWPETK